jgi:phosphoribosylamine--glycine ligase
MTMNVLLVGSGGREHALAWKLAQSPHLGKLYCAPGNPGMERHGKCVPIDAMDLDRLIEFAREHDIALTVVGPENPLAAGIVDRFHNAGLRAFGPSAAAARIESSKAFAKDLMARYGIPTARYAEFTDPVAAADYVKKNGAPIVIKADGLAAGKGVTVAMTDDEAIDAIQQSMVDSAFGAAGQRVVIEEFLEGEEASIFALSDGNAILPLVAAQDHKRVNDGDQGPNTGGMGAYSPAPIITRPLFAEIEERVLRPAIDGMAEDGHPYRGVLYAGLIITRDGPKVIEFNCRFGDQETQVVLPRMKSDLLPLLDACAHGSLEEHGVHWHEGACVTVVMASGGYPGAFVKGKVITGIDDAEKLEGVTVFHAGTKREANALLTNGGRVLNVTAAGPDIRATIARAYEAVDRIHFESAHWRKDIGHRALNRPTT